MPDLQYFYAENDQQRGPVGAQDLMALRLAPSTLVWREGLSNWQRLDSVPELIELLRAAQPAPAPPPPPFPQQPFPAQAFPPQPQQWQANQQPHPVQQPSPPYAAQQMGYSALPPRDNSKRVVAGIFGILMGGLGIHKFILGYTGAGLIMCLVTIFTCGYGGFIFAPIGIAEGSIFLSTNDDDFYQRYIVNKRPWF